MRGRGGVSQKYGIVKGMGEGGPSKITVTLKKFHAHSLSAL